jgi:hypothetical protein
MDWSFLKSITGVAFAIPLSGWVFRYNNKNLPGIRN